MKELIKLVSIKKANNAYALVTPQINVKVSINGGWENNERIWLVFAVLDDGKRFIHNIGQRCGFIEE